MRHIAIIGSGPAGYYAAEGAQKRWGDEVGIDIFDSLPVPFGLIRTGVAPDHQSIKAVSRRYEATAQGTNVRFLGNVTVGRDVTIDELRALYDAVVLATGAPHDRALGLPGEHLGNVFGSAAFVGWYNGHPQFADLSPDLSGQTAVVIGMGNVALDVARPASTLVRSTVTPVTRSAPCNATGDPKKSNSSSISRSARWLSGIAANARKWLTDLRIPGSSRASSPTSGRSRESTRGQARDK